MERKLFRKQFSVFRRLQSVRTRELNAVIFHSSASPVLPCFSRAYITSIPCLSSASSTRGTCTTYRASMSTPAAEAIRHAERCENVAGGGTHEQAARQGDPTCGMPRRCTCSAVRDGRRGAAEGLFGSKRGIARDGPRTGNAAFRSVAVHAHPAWRS